jgi:hypothetical protein
MLDALPLDVLPDVLPVPAEAVADDPELAGADGVEPPPELPPEP